MYAHLGINIFILICLILVSLIYMVLCNYSTVVANNHGLKNNHFLDLIFGYLNDKKNQESTMFRRYFFDLNKLTFLQRNSINDLLNRIYLKCNVIFMITSTCMLASYGFLLHIDFESNQTNKEIL